MSERAMTRRSFLAVGAGALAGGLLEPHAALAAIAAPAPPRPRLSECWVGELAPGSTRTVALARTADLVGLRWQAPARASVQLRFRTPQGHWGAWVAAGARGHGPDAPGVPGEQVGEPLWTGGTRELQLRAAAHALHGVSVAQIDVSGGVGARRAAAAAPLASAAALALASPQLQAGGGQPPIIARRAWARGIAPPRVSPGYGDVRLAFVHHTENPNGYRAGEVPAMLRAIWAFHRFTNGWNDIGYNFVLDLYGRIFEARAGGIDEPVIGAHAGGYNIYSTGVAVLGSFMSTPISPAARRALDQLLAWKLSLHGVPASGRVTVRVDPAGAVYSKYPGNARVSLPRIAGHRDADSTDCPGDVLYGTLPALRSSVLRLAARPSRLTLALAPPAAGEPSAPAAGGAPGTTTTPAPAPAGTTTTPAPAGTGTGGGEAGAGAQGGGLAGTLTLLDGTPIAAASVLVQARTVSARGEAVSERTIAEALTDAQGGWSVGGSYTAARSGGVALRALFAGGPAGAGATISEPLQVTAAAPLSAPPGPSPSG